MFFLLPRQQLENILDIITPPQFKILAMAVITVIAKICAKTWSEIALSRIALAGSCESFVLS